LISAKKLVKGEPYFYVSYVDEALTIPEILTLYYIGSLDGGDGQGIENSRSGWLFCRASSIVGSDEYASREIAIQNLQALHDWDGLIAELKKNREAQIKGEKFD